MRRFCPWLTAAFAVLYAAALALYAAGTFGFFGSARDPLAGVFLIPLGWPWNRFVDSMPQPAWPWLAALAPALNLAILGLACRWLRHRTPLPGQ